MKVVAIAGPEPGIGKSRTCWDVLVAFVDAGLPVLAVDCGGRGALSAINAMRTRNNFGALPVKPAGSPQALKRLMLEQHKLSETSLVLLDIPSGDFESEMKPFLDLADMVLVLVRADARAIAATGFLVRPLVRAGKRLHFLLVRTKQGGTTYSKDFLEKLGMTAQEARALLLPMSIAERPQLINDLENLGAGVIEALGNARVHQDSVGLASMEIRSIRQFLRDEFDI